MQLLILEDQYKLVLEFLRMTHPQLSEILHVEQIDRSGLPQRVFITSSTVDGFGLVRKIQGFLWRN